MNAYLTVRLFSRSLEPLRRWRVQHVFRTGASANQKGPRYYADVGKYPTDKPEQAEDTAIIYRARGFASLQIVKVTLA